MRIAYLDTIAGISGDMTLGAFVSAGVSLERLAGELRKLPLTGFELIGNHVQRSSIPAVNVEVLVTEKPKYHRHLKDILSIIEGSGLSPQVKARAQSIFRVIAEAEAKIHGTSVERVHFHEVGALDSLVDIVGAAICLDELGVEQVYSSPVKLGQGGVVRTEHGLLPTPVPATLEILRDYPTILTSIPAELTTPTGAGIVKALSSGTLSEETLLVRSVGYGAGKAEFGELPNLLRVVIGEIEGDADRDDVVLIETNIDDMNPQVYPFLLEKLLASGALDAYLVPVIMKKGRPGILLSVMARRLQLDEIVELIYLQTSTIGVRIQNIGRKKLPRRQVEIPTSFGIVRGKAVLRGGREVVAPEFEECRRIAEERRIPLLDVFRTIEREILARRGGDTT